MEKRVISEACERHSGLIERIKSISDVQDKTMGFAAFWSEEENPSSRGLQWFYASEGGRLQEALFSSMEVLDGIGSKTALFGFGGEKGGSGYYFFKAKRFEELKWKANHSANTATLQAQLAKLGD